MIQELFKLDANIYYSHSISLFDTIEEQKERAFIKKTLGNYFCPNIYYKVTGDFNTYEKEFGKPNIYVCSSDDMDDRNSGIVSRGVQLQIRSALASNKTCLYIASLNKVEMTLVPILAIREIKNTKGMKLPEGIVDTGGVLEALPENIKGQY